MRCRLTPVVALIRLLTAAPPPATCAWVLWKEEVAGKESLGAAQPWFLVKTFPDRAHWNQHLKISVEELKSKSRPQHWVGAFIDEEQGGVYRIRERKRNKKVAVHRC